LSAFLLWWLTGTPSESAAIKVASPTPGWVYRVILAVSAVLGLAAWGLSFLVSESPPDDEPTSSSDQTSRPHAKLPAAYWSVLAALGLFSLANSSDTFLMLRMGEFGYSPWQAVMLYAVYNVTYAGLSYPIGVLSDGLGRWRIIALGWLIYAGVYAGLAWLPMRMAWGAWPLMGLYGVYMALTDGVGKALIADHAPKESRGLAMGIFYATTGLTTLLASLLAGWIWDRWGAPAALSLGAGAALVALIALGISRLSGKRGA
jgi:MFS family permease